VRGFKDRPDRDRELLPAILALEESLPARPLRLGTRRETVDLGRTAMRACRAVRPAQLFEVLAGGVLVVEPLLNRHKVQLVFALGTHAIDIVL